MQYLIENQNIPKELEEHIRENKGVYFYGDDNGYAEVEKLFYMDGDREIASYNG